MRNLAELQKKFQHYLLQQDPRIESDIVDMPPVSANARLDIYRDAYYLRLLEALQHDYPVLSALLGDEQFDQLGRCYIDQFPSNFRSIRWYGQQLADFLQQNKHQDWLIEMAHFEWLLTESFDAADSKIVIVDEVAGIPHNQWPEMRFKLHPSLRELSLSWNTVAIWKSYKERKKFISTQKSHSKTDWIIWRKQLAIQFCSLQPDEIYMINAMAAGENFGQICEGLCEWIDEQQVAIQAAILLKRFVLDDLIQEIQY